MDDTDSTNGMCTTFLASEIIKEFADCDVIGYPRLVRLNPNIPWKTRGNGAITVRLGKGLGRTHVIGEIGGKRYFGYERGREIEVEDAKKRCEKIIKENAQFDELNTNPAFVIMDKKPPQKLYWQAVRDIVKLKDVKSILMRYGAEFKGYKNKRGLIGATSAISWRPGYRTFEIITYRDKKKWGTKRRLAVDSVIRMDRKFRSTFNNYDFKNHVVAISPNSPCPVLFGIRGDEPKDLPGAMGMIESENIDRWILYESNQGTDAHLKKSKISDIRKYTSTISTGRIISKPRTISGGHVIFSISNNGIIDCAAYEPTKEFRHLIRNLAPGDLVTVYGGVRKKPLTINIEKIEILSLAEIKVKNENPKCPGCGRRMKSMGANAGYRCPKCRDKVGEDSIIRKSIKRTIGLGLFEVPVCARRHLSKPINRMQDRNR